MQQKYKIAIIISSVIAILIIIGGIIKPEKMEFGINGELLSFRAPWFSKDSAYNYNFNSTVRGIEFGKKVGSLESLTTKEEERLKNLCEQTDACGKIISQENITGNNYSGVRFTIQHEGRSIDESAGYINEYRTFILGSEGVYSYWISASDLQNPEGVKKAADKIVVKIAPINATEQSE